MNEIEVYETEPTPLAVGKSDGILFFSPSAVESYLKQNTITNQMCFCIGQTTANALQNVTKNTVVANKPTIENTIIQSINHYKDLAS